MQENFEKEVTLLKQIETKELYQLFHKMQFDTLKPQWDLLRAKLLAESVDGNVVELLGPRSPDVPEWYEGEILQEISKSQKDILILHHVLDFLEDPLEALQLAQNSGFKTILIHEAPKDGSFRYHSNPEIPYFKNRHILAIERHHQDKGNKALDYILGSHEKVGWRVEGNTELDFVYVTDVNKKNLVKMELALDLIEHRLSGHPTKFDELLSELMTWYLTPNSQVAVKGCSRWIKLTR